MEEGHNLILPKLISMFFWKTILHEFYKKLDDFMIFSMI